MTLINKHLNQSIFFNNIFSLNQLSFQIKIVAIALISLFSLGVCFYYILSRRSKLQEITKSPNQTKRQNSKPPSISLFLKHLSIEKSSNNEKSSHSTSIDHIPVKLSIAEKQSNPLSANAQMTQMLTEKPKNEKLHGNALFIENPSLVETPVFNGQEATSLLNLIQSSNSIEPVDKDLRSTFLASKVKTDNLENLELQQAIQLSQLNSSASLHASNPNVTLKQRSNPFKKTPPSQKQPSTKKINSLNEDDLIQTTKASSDKCGEALSLSVESAKRKKSLRILKHIIKRNAIGNAFLELHFANKVHRNLGLAELRQQYGLFQSKKMPNLVGDKILRLTAEETIEFQTKF